MSKLITKIDEVLELLSGDAPACALPEDSDDEKSSQLGDNVEGESVLLGDKRNSPRNSYLRTSPAKEKITKFRKRMQSMGLFPKSSKFYDIVLGQDGKDSPRDMNKTVAKNPSHKSARARMLIVLGWHMFWTVLFFCAYFFRSGKFRHDSHFLSRTIAFACISATFFIGIVAAFCLKKRLYSMATEMILGERMTRDFTIVYIELWIMGPLRILGIWAPDNGRQQRIAVDGQLSQSDGDNGHENAVPDTHENEHKEDQLLSPHGRAQEVEMASITEPSSRGRSGSKDASNKSKTRSWTVGDWIQLVVRWLHITICAAPFVLLIVCDLKNLGDNLPSGRYARHVGYLLHEIYELVLYGTAVLVFWNASFVDELFLLDNADPLGVFASVPEKDDDYKANKKSIAGMIDNCLSQSKGSIVSDENKPKREIRTLNRDVVYSVWGFTWWFMTPVALFALVAYCASVTLDTVPYRSYGENNAWLPYVFNLTPLGGTSYFVGNGFVSGTSFIISMAVWFCCRTVALELNRIAKRFNENFEVQDLMNGVHEVQERMDKLFNELKYIILIQTAFAIVMIALLAVQILGKIPNIHIVIVDEDSFVSAFVSLCQSVVTIAFASQIFEQWNCIYQVLMNYERQLVTNDAYKGDVMHMVQYVERAPIGVKMFGFFIGEQFLNNMVMLVVGEACTLGWQIANNSLAK